MHCPAIIMAECLVHSDGPRLGGDSRYSGKLVHKPWIGDGDRDAEAEDINRAGRIMIAGEILCLCLIWAAALIR